MKPRGIQDFQLAGWMISCFLTALIPFPANGSDAAPVVDASPVVSETAKTQAEENPEKPVQDPVEPTIVQAPLGDFGPPAPTVDVPLSALPEMSPVEDVPNTFPVIVPAEDSPAFVTPKFAEEDAELADDSAANIAPPWVPASGGFMEQTGTGFGNGGLPAAPSGFTSMAPSFPMGRAGDWLDGFSASTTFSTTYESNINPGGTTGRGDDPQEDIILMLGGGLSYMSKAREWTFGGHYSGSYNQYLNQTDFSGYNQAFGLLGHYDGTKLDASLSLGGGVEQGTNRYYQSDFVEQTSLNVGLNLSYQYSPKTSFQGNYGQRFTVAGGDEYNDTSSFQLSFASLWQYSKLTQFGPGLRYSSDSSGADDTRTSISPEFLLNYKLSTKVSLNSRVGMEFSQYESGGSSDPALTGSLGLNYNASKLWGMNLSVFSGTQAAPSATASFTQVSSIQLGYHRRLRQASLGLGIGYEIDSTQTSNDTESSNSGDGNSFNFNASLGMPIFANTCAATIFLGYRKETGDVEDSWDSTRAGFGISRQF